MSPENLNTLLGISYRDSMKKRKTKKFQYPALEEFFGTKDIKVTALPEPSQSLTATLLGNHRMLIVIKKNGRTVRGILQTKWVEDFNRVKMEEKLAALKERLEA